MPILTTLNTARVSHCRCPAHRSHQHQCLPSAILHFRFVLFTSSGEASLQHLKESWDEAARSQLTEAVPVYHAVVDIEEQPFLAERFNIQALPAFLLFRNRKVDSHPC